MIEKRCFLQWFVLTLGYVAGAFFAWRYGLLQAIWSADVTHMTTIIGAMFVASCGYLGFASWRYEGKWHRFRDSVAYADIGLGNFAGAAVIYVGLIGTVIGVMLQLQALGHVDPSNPQSGFGFLGDAVKALSTAFYATGAGLVASLLIGKLTANLTYFLHRNEVAE